MKTYTQLTEELALHEANKFKSKGIYTAEGKKVMGERSSKYQLMGLQEDGESLTGMTWLQWKKLNVPDTSSEQAHDKFIKSCLVQVKQFNRKVDFNSFAKRGNPSFEDKVDFLVKNCGVKIPKSGIKSL